MVGLKKMGWKWDMSSCAQIDVVGVSSVLKSG